MLLLLLLQIVPVPVLPLLLPRDSTRKASLFPAAQHHKINVRRFAGVEITRTDHHHIVKDATQPQDERLATHLDTKSCGYPAQRTNKCEPTEIIVSVKHNSTMQPTTSQRSQQYTFAHVVRHITKSRAACGHALFFPGLARPGLSELPSFTAPTGPEVSVP